MCVFYLDWQPKHDFGNRMEAIALDDKPDALDNLEQFKSETALYIYVFFKAYQVSLGRKNWWQ